jgi:hypothetical protein
MGCHDGVTAVDKHGPDVGTAAGTAAYKALPGTVMSSPGRAITDLTVTHPIGFLYGDAVTERNVGGFEELIDPSTGAEFVDRVQEDLAANLNNSRSIVDPLASVNASAPRDQWTYTGKKISDTLYGGYMTCASCHEVHNLNNSPNDPSVSNPAYTPNYFVWAREKGSALCLSCHVK